MVLGSPGQGWWPPCPLPPTPARGPSRGPGPVQLSALGWVPVLDGRALVAICIPVGRCPTRELAGRGRGRQPRGPAVHDGLWPQRYESRAWRAAALSRASFSLVAAVVADREVGRTKVPTAAALARDRGSQRQLPCTRPAAQGSAARRHGMLPRWNDRFARFFRLAGGRQASFEGRLPLKRRVVRLVVHDGVGLGRALPATIGGRAEESPAQAAHGRG